MARADRADRLRLQVRSTIAEVKRLKVAVVALGDRVAIRNICSTSSARADWPRSQVHVVAQSGRFRVVDAVLGCLHRYGERP